jgi:hypothetical protein
VSSYVQIWNETFISLLSAKRKYNRNEYKIIFHILN